MRITVHDGGWMLPPVIVNDRAVPKAYTLNIEHEDGRPELLLGFEVRDGVPQCRSAELRSTEDGREVLSSDLRGVKLEDLLEFALVNVAMVYEQGETPQPDPSLVGRPDLQLATPGLRTPGIMVLEPAESEAERRQTLTSMRSVRREARRKVTDDLLREVARVYRDNVANNPTEAVEAFTGRSHRTAALYVKRAREAGFLGAASRGRAGEQS